MRIGSLFSGIGGLEYGLELAGCGHTVWQVEQSHFCREVLAGHWPRATRYEDVRTVGSSTLAPVDLVCGGFPCQDISLAGPGAGLNGERSGLWREFARIVGELRPSFVVAENVAALVSRGLDRVVSDLERLGYHVEARILAAEDVGAPHRRRRLFIVAYTRQTGREGADQREPQHAESARCGAPMAYTRGDGRDSALADAHGDRVRLERQRVPGGRTGDLRARRDTEPLDDGATGGRQAQPRLGGGVAGVPCRLDRWPSRPGDEPQDWEPPRSTQEKDPYRRKRLAALGNAVVPQVAELVGRRVMDIIATERRGPIQP